MTRLVSPRTSQTVKKLITPSMRSEAIVTAIKSPLPTLVSESCSSAMRERMTVRPRKSARSFQLPTGDETELVNRSKERNPAPNTSRKTWKRTRIIVLIARSIYICMTAVLLDLRSNHVDGTSARSATKTVEWILKRSPTSESLKSPDNSEDTNEIATTAHSAQS